MLFADRRDAGRRLAAHLSDHADDDTVVLGLPRGGVVVAYEVAEALDAPLDVIVVRKLGVPTQPELAMGAIGEGGVRVLDAAIVHRAQVDGRALHEVEQRERAELARRVQRFRGDSDAVEVAGRTAIVVDDGIATGATARAACRIAREHGARHIVLAVPVGPPGVEERMGADADEVVCLHSPRRLGAVGQAYRDFRQTTDAEVADLLTQAAQRRGGRAHGTR